MFGKPHHKMPTSSWMTPGGNRENKRELMKTQAYPMKSAIKRNLGGPLSSVFFSCLSPAQQEYVGYTPRLAGPGRDLWVSPSDILEGQVVLTPPYSSHLRQALTHQGIMAIGADIEEKMARKHDLDKAKVLEDKEKEISHRVEAKIKEAVEADRRAHQLTNDHIQERISSDLKASFQEVLDSAMAEALYDGKYRLEEAVARTKQEMEEQLCLAVASHAEHLARQYEFQNAWCQSQLYEKYENQLKDYQKNCSLAIENAEKDFTLELEKAIARLEAEHINEILSKVNDQRLSNREEKIGMEDAFHTWFMEYFNNEIAKRDFDILSLEHAIRKLETKCSRRENQIKEIFRHFQKFINFALKEKPGQAEFLLHVQKELDGRSIVQREEETEQEYISRLIIEYIVKNIDDHSVVKDVVELVKQGWKNYTIQNFRGKIAQERVDKRLLQLFGEDIEETMNKEKFKKSRKISMASMFNKNPSMIPVLLDTHPEKNQGQ